MNINDLELLLMLMYFNYFVLCKRKFRAKQNFFVSNKWDGIDLEEELRV